MLSSQLAAACPAVLHAYWALATSAALLAALPMHSMQGFRCVNVFKLQDSAAAQWLLHIMLIVACAHACRHAVQLSAARGKLWDNRPPVSLGPLTVIQPCSWVYTT